MGITGLIPFLEKASSKINISSLKGSTVAIDTYCWLHKGAFACAEKLVRGETTDVHINYCLKYVNMLLKYDIKPILVFDGRHLPAKALTEAKRRENRKASKKRAAELLRMGKTEEARSHLRRCVDITHEMALQLIKECRKRNVDCIVAPYEADAQLAFLNTRNIAQYVITEDSDLVLFGCSNILFKLDLNGCCLLVESTKLHIAMGCRPEKYSFSKFRHMCIMSGCDYLDSLPGIGLAKACKFIMKTEETDLKRSLLKIPVYLNMRQLVVTPEYIDSFIKADATFQHMIVFDPITRKATRLNDPAECGTDLEHCSNAGEFMDDELAFKLALGNLNPFSLKKLDDFHPDHVTKPSKAGKKKGFAEPTVTRHKSIWEPSFKPYFTSPKSRKSPFSNKFTFKSKAIRQPQEPLEVENETTEQEMLASYMLTADPPRKRQKLPNAFDDLDAFAQKANHHNPFVKADNVLDIIASPTKITDSNRSLLKNVSPVKRINFRDNGLKKLSQFNRTVVDEKQRILSRFFASNSDIVTKNSEPPEESSVSVPESVNDIENVSESRQLDANTENNDRDDGNTSADNISQREKDCKSGNDVVIEALNNDEAVNNNETKRRSPRTSKSFFDTFKMGKKTPTTSPPQKRKIDEMLKANLRENSIICLSSPESLLAQELNEKTPTKSPSVWTRNRRVPVFKLPDISHDDDSTEPSCSSSEPSCSQSSESCSSQSISQTASLFSMRPKPLFGTQQLSPIEGDDKSDFVASSPTILLKSPSIKQKPSQTCRRLGLSKTRTKKKTEKGQCRLSMFGFQKKIQLPTSNNAVSSQCEVIEIS